MEKSTKNHLSQAISNSDTYVAENNSSYQTNDSISFDIGSDEKVNGITSQLLSIDGWENYQKELIQLCFEFWEVSESQVEYVSTNDLEVSSNAEMQAPLSLFAEKTNDLGANIISEAEATLDNSMISKEVQNKECVEDYRNLLHNYKHEIDSVTQRISNEVNNTMDRKYYGNISNAATNRENKRIQKKKLKMFSLHKNTYKPAKQNKKLQSFTCDRSVSIATACAPKDLRKYKQWLDSAEQINRYDSDADMTTSEADSNRDRSSAELNSDGALCEQYLLDAETNRMERKVRKFVKFLKEKHGLLWFPSTGVNELSETKSKSLTRKFYKNALWSDHLQHDKLDLRLLDDYAGYVDGKLRTWQTLLDGLEDARARIGQLRRETASKPDETIGYGFPEGKSETECGCSGRSKFAGIEAVLTGDPGKQNLLSGFLRTLMNTVRPRYEALQKTGRFRSWCSCTAGRTKRARGQPPIRKCVSDTDLQSMWKSSEPLEPWKEWEPNGEPGREERQECFRMAVARLEYVGSTFRDPCRLTGLKVLCKVDVLSGFGYPAEAVHLFVSTALPLSNDPDLMIRRAEAAYDWKFFCHLSMWRYSYND